MKIYASGEDYLEAVLILQKQKGVVRSMDLVRHMGYSKPSISHAVSVLRDGGFLNVDAGGFLHLTAAGREVAEKIYEKHRFFTSQLIAVGADPAQAEQDACKISASSARRASKGSRRRCETGRIESGSRDSG